MSYGMMAWRVDLDLLQTYCTPAGELTITTVELANSIALARYDNNGLSEIPIRQTIQDLLNGERNYPNIGFQYGYALELLCPFCGEMLDNDRVYPLSSRWFDEIDAVWAKLGMSDVIAISGLLYRGAPIRLPSSGDFPCIGYFTAAECQTLFDRLFDDDAKLKITLDTSDFPTQIVSQICDWICIAAQMKQGIICFYY
jgi:hypothetical protein